MEQTKTNHIVYFDYLRILACIAVIVIHVTAQNFYIDVNTFEWKVFNLFDSIVRWAVPIFVMISGAIFLDKNRKIDIKKLYTKNILRLICAFVFWSFIYTVYTKIVYKSSIEKLVQEFFKGSYHMWFIPMMIGLYIIIPIARKIVEDEKITKYFLGISLIFTFILPMIMRVNKLAIIKTSYENMMFHVTLGYLPYFILGYYLHNKEFSKKEKIISYIIGIVGFCSTILLNAIVSTKRGEASVAFFNELQINILFQVIGVFVFAKYNLNKIPQKLEKIVTKLSKYSFGIYLVHILVLNLIRIILKINTLSFNAILTVPVITIMVFVISAIISGILNSIPKINKYIV